MFGTTPGIVRDVLTIHKSQKLELGFDRDESDTQIYTRTDGKPSLEPIMLINKFQRRAYARNYLNSLRVIISSAIS